MATQRKPKPDPAPVESESAEQASPPPPRPKKRGKLLVITGALLLALGGGGSAYYFLQPSDSAAGAVVPKPPVFLPLEAFTVNLASDGSAMQFMQAGITLKLSEKATADIIKERLPEVRNSMLLVLSAKRASEILTVTGKQKLAGEMSEAIRKVIAPPTAAAAAQAKAKALAAEGADVSAVQAEDKAASGSASPPAPGIEVLFTAFIIQ
jgi:flagellar protein FliL